ncbi:hypothetical protein [Paenibacillus marinisediminis]
MAGIAKSILIAIIVSIGLMIFTNFIFFFSWYSTLILETFNLSQVAAGDNYIKQTYYEDALESLRERPVFRERADKIVITALNSSDFKAIGNDDETTYESASERDKPYRQRGEPIKIEIKAEYPLSVTLWGKKYEQVIPVSFSLTATGLKHYKDLDYYFD